MLSGKRFQDKFYWQERAKRMARRRRIRWQLCRTCRHPRYFHHCLGKCKAADANCQCKKFRPARRKK